MTFAFSELRFISEWLAGELQEEDFKKICQNNIETIWNLPFHGFRNSDALFRKDPFENVSKIDFLHRKLKKGVKWKVSRQ